MRVYYGLLPVYMEGHDGGAYVRTLHTILHPTYRLYGILRVRYVLYYGVKEILSSGYLVFRPLWGPLWGGILCQDHRGLPETPPQAAGFM